MFSIADVPFGYAVSECAQRQYRANSHQGCWANVQDCCPVPHGCGKAFKDPELGLCHDHIEELRSATAA